MSGKSKSRYGPLRYRQALATYDRALIARAEDWELWYDRGRLLAHLRRLDEAVASFRHSIALDPRCAKVRVSLGQLLMYQQKDIAALAQFDQALALSPQAALVWVYKGFALGRLGQYRAALDSFDHAIDLAPKLNEAWHHRGLMLMKLRRYDEGYESFRTALQCQAYDYKGWLCLGWALEKLGDYGLAVEAYNKSLGIEPDQSFAFYRQARCYALLQDPDSAMEHLRRAIALNPKHYQQRVLVDPVLKGIQAEALSVEASAVVIAS